MYLIYLTAFVFLIFQGCSDDDTTTAAPETTTTTTTTPMACGKVTPKGYMTINTEESNGGYRVTTTTCDKYEGFQKVVEDPIANLNLLNAIGFIVGIHTGDFSVLMGDGTTKTAQDLKTKFAGELTDEMAEKLLTGLEYYLAGEDGQKEVAKILEKAKGERVAASMEVLDTLRGNPEYVEIVVNSFLLALGVKDLIFTTCNSLLEHMGGLFHGRDVDAFCDPNAGSVAEDKSTCNLGEGRSSTTELRFDDERWGVKNATCFGKSDEIVKGSLKGVLDFFEQQAPFTRDISFHRIPCEEFSGLAGEWLVEVGEGICDSLHTCHSYSTDKNYSIEVGREKSMKGTKIVKKFACKAYEMDFEDKEWGEALDKLGLMKMEGEDEDEDKTPCEAFKKIFDKENGHDPSDFCSTEKRDLDLNKTMDCMFMKDNTTMANVARANGTWTVMNVTCTGEISEEAKTRLKDTLSAFEAGTFKGDFFHRATCKDLLKHKAEVFGEKVANACHPPTTTAEPAATTAAAAAATTAAAAAATTEAPSALML